MTKGRNTTVVSLRLLNVVIQRLKWLAEQRGQSLPEMLKPIVMEFASHGDVKTNGGFRYPTEGRRTSVISLRLPDEVIKLLKSLARKRRVSMTELLKPVIIQFAISRSVPNNIEAVPEEADDPRSLVSRGSPTPVTATKVGRNDPCPCGSGKKYKKCHGA